MPTKCCWVIHGSLTSERKASTSPLSFINHSTLLLNRALKRQAPCLYNTCTSKFERSTGSESERVDALGLRAVEVIICMITRDFSVISMTSQASLSLSLSTCHKSHDAQYRKRFLASYNRRWWIPKGETFVRKLLSLPYSCSASGEEALRDIIPLKEVLVLIGWRLACCPHLVCLLPGKPRARASVNPPLTSVAKVEVHVIDSEEAVDFFFLRFFTR